MKNLKRTAAAVAGVAALTLALGACGNGGDGGSADGKVSITVSGMPDTSKPEERAAWVARLEAFREANPDIDIEPTEVLYDEQTFAAQLAGGTLPTVIAVPPGEVPGLAQREQIREVTSFIEANETFSTLPESLLGMGRAADGKLYGVPEYAYSMGLLINRDVFEQAGLDPDEPLETWDDVRAAAKQITDTTGLQGFAVPATEGTGGWITASMVPGFGGGVVVEDGDTFRADLTGEATTAMFELLHAMAQEDGSMGSNALISMNEISLMIAGGQLGMTINGGDAYQNMILVNGMPPEHYGMFPMPQNADGIGTSGGGRVSIIRPDATDEQVEAVIKWLEFVAFEPYTSQEAAVEWAEARVAEGLPVPEVGLPRVGGDVYSRFMGWIESYVNVPLDQIQSYLDSASDLPLVDPFPVAAGEIFAIMDPVIQAVLGRADADVPALLADANTAAQAAVEAALQG